MTFIDPDSEGALEANTIRLFESLGWDVNASEKVIRFSRFRPEPGIQSRAPVGGDAVGTLQQFLN